MKRDPIEEFMKHYGRLYDRLEPRDQEIVMDSLSRDAAIPRSDHMKTKEEARLDATIDSAAEHDAKVWKERVTERQGDPSKEKAEPAQALTEPDKTKHLERDADVVEKKEALEKSWLAEMKSRAEQSMYTGRGATDELSVSSGGQFSASFSQQVRPGSTRADLDNAVEKMGLGPARDRQQQVETQKESDKSRDLGKEAER